MPRVLNKPSSWKPQVNVNTKRMKQLMKDVRTDVVARTRNSKDLDQWMQKLAPYTASNCFVTGAHAQPMQELVNQIAGVVNQTSLPSGSNAEMVKGVMAEACMTMVTNVGEDIKNDLRRIAVDAYNQRMAPRDTAQLMGEKIDSFSRARCQAIARTETCRAANLANHINAQEMGAKSYSVICNEGACEYCIAEYGANQDTVYAIDDTENLPPYHTNCRCTPTYSMEEPPNKVNEEPIEEEPQTTPKTTTETTVNPRVTELEKLIKDEQALADKWRKRGNTELAKTFEAKVKQYKEELNNLKKPTTKKPVKTQEEQKQDDIINNALADALKDVGLESEAPARKPINPNVKIDKNIETTHKSNLWEKLAEKHGFELVEASKTKVTFYDKKHETPIRCHIPQNKEWIDYTNRGLKKINIEDILTSYNSASTIQKKATPIINLKGKNLDQGVVLIGKDTFEMNLYEGAFYKMEGSINGGNTKGAMHHEMWHCVDIRLTDEYEARVLNLLNSNKPRSDYKKTVTKDRRIKNKTGGSNFVSGYARQSGSGNKVYEDFAESGSVMSSNTFLVQDAVGGYVKVTKKEFIEQYPNRAKYIQDIMDNGELLW